jgi:hypothetical protein
MGAGGARRERDLVSSGLTRVDFPQGRPAPPVLPVMVNDMLLGVTVTFLSFAAAGVTVRVLLGLVLR